MKSQTLFILLFTIGYTQMVLASNSPLINKDNIVKLTSEYIVLLQKTINEKSSDYMAEMSEYFNNPRNNEHTDDLSNKRGMDEVDSYFSYAYNAVEIKEVESETQQIDILDCTYFDPNTSQQYVYVKIPKKLHWSSGRTGTTYYNYLAINITKPVYKIDYVYDDSAETLKNHITPCLKTQLDQQKQQLLAKEIEDYYSSVTKFYSEANYFQALEIIDIILELNPNYIAAIDAKEAVLNFLNSSIVDDSIKANLSNRKTHQAQKGLNLAKKYRIGNPSDWEAWGRLIRKAEEEAHQQLKYEKANYFFANEMFQQALPIYKELRREGAIMLDLDKKINICQDSDPELIQKRIKQAYNAAVASRKNYEAAFTTYYKYENSGYLQGTNYRFMCLMMIDKNNKKLLRNIGMTGNQAKNMAVKYFYKASEMGTNTKDIEMLVFTQNFNKLRKN